MLEPMGVSFSQGSFLGLSPGGFHRIACLDRGKPAAKHVAVCVHGMARDLARMRAMQPGIGHAPALMSYDQIAAIRGFLLR